MKQLFSRHTGLAALVLLAGLVLPVLFGTVAQSSNTEGPSVRMAVDPTVLPPVLPPDEAAGTAPATAPSPAPDDKAGEADLPPESATAPAVRPKPPIVTVVEPPDAPTPQPPAQAEKPAPEPPAQAEKSVPESPIERKAEPAASPAAVKGGPGTVRRIGLESTPHGFALTLSCDRPVGDTTYMNLTNPRRLVVDLRQPWKLKTRNVVRSASGMVRHVVVGEHKDRLRFVIHFRTPPKGPLSPEFRRSGKT